MTNQHDKLIVSETSHDPIKQPSWYTSHPSGVECKDIVVHHNWAIGSAIAYLWRAGLKGSAPEVNDLRKAIECIGFEIARLEALPPALQLTAAVMLEAPAAPLMGTVVATNADGTVDVRVGPGKLQLTRQPPADPPRAWLYVHELTTADEGKLFECVDCEEDEDYAGSVFEVNTRANLVDIRPDCDNEIHFRCNGLNVYLKPTDKVRHV